MSKRCGGRRFSDQKRVAKPLTAIGCALALLLGLLVCGATGQDLGGASTQPEGPPVYRKLAPGVMREVVPPLTYDDTFSRHDVVEILARRGDLDWAKNIWFRRTVWYLDFKFKDLRFGFVDIPQPDGKLERKLVWYLVYSVTNPGKAIRPRPRPDGTFEVETVDQPVFFVPEFYLEARDNLDSQINVYRDQLIPVAIPAIREREDRNREFLNSVQLTREIQVGETYWGIATWVDIDPRTDYISLYVGGLTNAYRWEDPPGAYRPDMPPGEGRKFTRKMLKINFWRPGDEYYEHEKEIRYGIPGQVDYEWVMR